jgi:hypothetical protein
MRLGLSLVTGTSARQTPREYCKRLSDQYYLRSAYQAVHPGCGRSSGVERNLAKVEVVSSNLIARSNFNINQIVKKYICISLKLSYVGLHQGYTQKVEIVFHSLAKVSDLFIKFSSVGDRRNH